MEDIIRSQRGSRRILPFIGLGCGILFGAIMLIGLYGKEVGATSALRKVEAEAQKARVEQATLQQQIVALTQSEHLRQLASESGLIEEKTPEYFRVNDQWVAASRF